MDLIAAILLSRKIGKPTAYLLREDPGFATLEMRAKRNLFAKLKNLDSICRFNMDDFTLTPTPVDDTPRHGPRCCVECFDDQWLRSLIEVASRHIGPCEFCGSENVKLIHVSYLSPYFLNLTKMYSPVSYDNTIFQLEDAEDAGEFLDTLIQEDWAVFSDLLDGEGQMDLLESILNTKYTDAEWTSRAREEHRFDPAEFYTSRQNPGDYKLVDEWDEHKQRLLIRAGNADPFPVGRSDFYRISVIMPAGSIVYRARLGFETIQSSRYSSHDEPYKNSKIGAPPAWRAKAGRANRDGESVFYCADQEDTAVAEVRPARGNTVSLGVFRITRDLQLLDLAMEQTEINPFTDPNLAMTVELRDLFDAFAHDLAKPLRRSDDVKEYLPSQSLTEAIRVAKFDGIRYPSAMKTGGSNVVLFEPVIADFVSSDLIEVISVSYKFRRV